ncbi:hypothetical protein SAMD00019534_121040 [Acytostelium subglobosum LB1]|uniref:hypothetical protein n=1 Tax=Acytostelium subglobosum LB1 TaxID=1410327 RepID=UPI00064518C7|nr:hypothetical protein SAMD00019534_121040 [Acytostelium subglobosum LB1]GAM28928.1 hypothetical protein SAMD00019534_121040 [Acytostelium subglobosum LB1]|eukprot:XP_012748113.1 hypothetical protein SAMD00019534_121040 [Acytostelium subglobosum LB1]
MSTSTSTREKRDKRTIVPTSFRSIRACVNCGLVKTTAQFDEYGCENCDRQSERRKDRDTGSATTTNFEGIMAIMKPTESWIARRQHYERRVPGCYALSIKDDDSQR